MYTVNNMIKNKLPKFESMEDLVEFFNTHDMGEYLDEMPEVQFDVVVKKIDIPVEVDRELRCDGTTKANKVD